MPGLAWLPVPEVLSLARNFCEIILDQKSHDPTFFSELGSECLLAISRTPTRSPRRKCRYHEALGTDETVSLKVVPSSRRWEICWEPEPSEDSREGLGHHLEVRALAD